MSDGTATRTVAAVPWTILTKARLDERMDTAVMKTPTQLIDWLATNS